MRTVLLLLIMTSVSQLIYGHGVLIKGHVVDSVSGASLNSASVTLDGDDIRYTDQSGFFRFDGLASGKHTLYVSYVGYRSREIVLTLSEDETISLTIKMEATIVNLREITIGGSAFGDGSIGNVSKIDLAIRPVKSSQDVLRLIPGLVTAQHAGGGKAEQIFLRGFDIDHGTDITLTVDGMPVNMVSHAHGQGYADLHFLIPEVIDYVDFNKGPYYASVGDFNTAGYANFQTLNQIEKSRMKIEAGRFDTYRLVGMFDVFSDQSKNQNAYVATEYHYTNGPFESPQHFKRLNLFGKFTGKVSDDKFVSLSLSTFRSEWDASGQIPVRAVESGLISRFGSLDDTEGGVTGRSNLNFSVLKQFENGGTLKNHFYVSKYDFELFSNFTFFLNDSLNGDQILQREDRTIYGYNGVGEKRIFVAGKPVDVQLGVGLRYDNVSGNELSHTKARYTFLNGIALGDVDQINGNAYADFRFDLSRKLFASVGARFDAFNFQYADRLDSLYESKAVQAGVFSPKANLFYNATPSLQFYLKTGTGFHSNDTRVVIARKGEEVLPKAFGSDLGVYAKPFSNVLINIAAWYLNLEQEFVYVGDEAVVEASGETERYGVDVSLRYQPREWLFFDFDGNYAFGRAVGEPEGENFIPLAPDFTSIGGVTLRSKKGVDGSLRYRYISDRPANENNSVVAEGYFLLDAGISYTTRSYEVSLVGSNLLNQAWNEAQFDTETRLPGELQSMSELTFTPGDPVFFKASITIFF